MHVVKLDILSLQAKYLYSESFTNGEVTSFHLFQLAGKIHAVACLWWDKAVYLDFYSITDQERVKTISLQERK